ncbi:MAG TPA: hypothetical protein VJJ22_02850 [Candidatus Paceibacterota bacterium]
MERLIIFFDKLRSKPEVYRRAVAFWVSLGITAVIVLVWLQSLAGRLGRSENTAMDGYSPFSEIGNVASSFITSLKNVF